MMQVATSPSSSMKSESFSSVSISTSSSSSQSAMLTGLLFGHSLDMCLSSLHLSLGLAYGLSLFFVVGAAFIARLAGGASITLWAGGHTLDVEPCWVLVLPDAFSVAPLNGKVLLSNFSIFIALFCALRQRTRFG